MSTISNVLRQWYSEHKRDLPWRVTTDPYLIWLSEIILQQTRVNQGLDYYLKFKETFPTVKDLAEADLDLVLKLWQGLGYYSRARNLHKSAKMVMNEFGGTFPSSYNDLIKLKGVGQYTAAAVSSFSINEANAVVDGNVFRVLSRLFNEATPINTPRGQKLFLEIGQELLEEKHAGEHNQAIMEFGALQCTPKNPKCMYCPLQEKCMAYQKGNVDKLPVKQGKVKVTNRYLYFFVQQHENKIAVEKRGDSGIWKGLYQFPMIELKDSDKELEAIKLHIRDAEADVVKVSSEIIHILSHQRLHIKFIHVKHSSTTSSLQENTWVDEEEFQTLAIPRAIDRYLENTSSIFE